MKDKALLDYANNFEPIVEDAVCDAYDSYVSLIETLSWIGVLTAVSSLGWVIPMPELARTMCFVCMIIGAVIYIVGNFYIRRYTTWSEYKRWYIDDRDEADLYEILGMSPPQ